MQLAEVDAAKRLDLAGHRLRVGERRIDEIVELEILDVERLAHVRAAVLQNLNDLALIGDRIEMRSHGIRSRGHLTERESGGEHLYEDEIHNVRIV